MVQLGNDMSKHDLTAPTAAELYFHNSIFGQLYTLLAEGLGQGSQSAQHESPGRHVDAPAPSSTAKRSLLERLDDWLWRLKQRDRERYLAGAKDVFELEQRMQAYERESYPRYY